MTVNPWKIRPGDHKLRVTRADVDMNGGIRDMFTYGELQAEHLRTRARGDMERAGLIREVLVRRVLVAAQRRERSAA